MAEGVQEGIVEEFANAELGDPRRNARLIKIAESVARKPDQSFPLALSNSADLEAAYRFFGNVHVTPEAILQPHVHQTVRRVSEEPVTLVAHDTTTVSFTSEDRDGLVSRGEQQQFLAHCSLAVRADGSRQALGVLALSQHLPIKTPGIDLQDRWGAHVLAVHALGVEPARVVHLMDREADDYELFDLLVRIGARFVIRVQYDRRLESGSLRELIAHAQLVAEREVKLSRRASKNTGPKQRKIHPPREERTAQLAIAACEVALKRPGTAQDATASTLKLNVVRVWEPAPVAGEEPVEWLLYTVEPIDTPEQILQVVDWYRARWVLEEYFKALKTGCALEKRQLTDLHALCNALAVLAPVAWRLLCIRSEARVRPTAPATLVLAEQELVVLRAAAARRRRPLPKNPTTHDAVLAIAALGGHLKHNGFPGWMTIARGFQKLRTLLEGWSLRDAVETEIVAQSCDQS